MSSITGLFHLDGSKLDTALLKSMNDEVHHRGPDDEGFLFFDSTKKEYFTAGGVDTPDIVWKSKF